MGREPEGLLDLGGTDAVMLAVLGSCLGRVHHSAAQLLAGRDAESLHQARVSLRRLRSALRLFRPVTGPLPAVEAGLRDLSAVLGAARDLDVLLARSSPGPLHDRLSAARHEALSHALAALQAAPAQALLNDLAHWIVAHPPLPAQDARAYAARQLDRCRRQVKRSGRALEDGDDAARHRLRKQVKRLRHGCELFGSLFPAPGRRARFMAALRPLQDALGALNDLVMAHAVLGRLGSSRTRGAAALIGKGQRPMLLAAAANAHEELMAAPRFWR